MTVEMTVGCWVEITVEMIATDSNLLDLSCDEFNVMRKKSRGKNCYFSENFA